VFYISYHFFLFGVVVVPGGHGRLHWVSIFGWSPRWSCSQISVHRKQRGLRFQTRQIETSVMEWIMPTYLQKPGQSQVLVDIWHQFRYGARHYYFFNFHAFIVFRSLNVDAIIRGGLRRYTDQLGHFWNSLADYYVRSGLFERVSTTCMELLL